jgi:thiosulfate/3-mercaptopyruvate sulfurtransferase
MHPLKSFALIVLATLAGGSLAGAEAPAQPAPAVSTDAQQSSWQSFLTPAQVKARLADANAIVIDVRSADEYAKGHIPGAISLPGKLWRTPEAKPGHGDSQYIFRKPDGSPDIARYEALLGDAGLTRDREVIIYGNHAGKADGSVPAMILSWLGQKDVRFLDGVGLSEWHKAGYETSTEPRQLPAARYAAAPRDGFVWNLHDVLANLTNPRVVFYDTRAPREFTGEELKSNKRGGHIPGAVLCNYEEFLDKDKKTISRDQVARKLAERGITPDKTVVLYCQTATRVSLPYLALRDLGYNDVVIYDASWHEYGNRDDTPIERDAKLAADTLPGDKLPTNR